MERHVGERVAQQLQKPEDTQVQSCHDEVHVCFLVDLQEFGIPGADTFTPVFHIHLSLVLILVVFAPLDHFLHSCSVHLPQPNHDVLPFLHALDSLEHRRDGGALLRNSAARVNREGFPIAAPEPDDHHIGDGLKLFNLARA